MGLADRSRSLLALAFAALSGTACNRDAVANPNAEKPAEKSAAMPHEQESQVVTEGKAQFDETQFNVSIAPRAAVDKGQSGELIVLLTAKPPFHVNQEYPHRLNVTAMRGLSTPSNTIQRDPARVTLPRLELLVPVTLGQNGPFGLDAEFSFSLCTDEKCLMEKRHLSVALASK